VKLVVGLGNPGPRYVRTRHNVGFRVVERFAERHAIALSQTRFSSRFGRGRADGIDVGLLQPQEFMNRSGTAVAEALRMLPVEDAASDLLVVFDDLDLPFAQLRLRPSGGAGGHRGMEDVIRCLGGEGFARLRFGIGRPPAGSPIDPVAWVLQEFSAEEEAALRGAVDAAAHAVLAWARDGVQAAMNAVNRRAPAPGVDAPRDA
jgi:PTH1 family peptidyl-tRNA hydrolase